MIQEYMEFVASPKARGSTGAGQVRYDVGIA
jgi:hypothetical protein